MVHASKLRSVNLLETGEDSGYLCVIDFPDKTDVQSIEEHLGMRFDFDFELKTRANLASDRAGTSCIH